MFCAGSSNSRIDEPTRTRSPHDNCTVHCWLYLCERLWSQFCVNRRQQLLVLISWGRWITSNVLALKSGNTFCSCMFTNERQTVTHNDLTVPVIVPRSTAVSQSVRFGALISYKSLEWRHNKHRIVKVVPTLETFRAELWTFSYVAVFLHVLVHPRVAAS